MTALALTAVGGTGRETSVALAADLLVAVVLAGEHLERGLNDTTTQTEDEVEGRLLLDVVVGEGAAILELLAGEDETLLVRRNALLVLDLALHIVDCVRGLDLKGDGLARQGLNEAIAKTALVPVPSFRSHAQVVRCGVVCVFAIRWVGVRGRVYVHLHC